MTNKELLLSAVQNGEHDDKTISAALDAIREESDWTLLQAVLQVALVYNAAQSSRDIAEATKYLDRKSPIRFHLTEVIKNNALNAHHDAHATITVIAGDSAPFATINSREWGVRYPVLVSISVGALWVKRVANQIMVEREREEANKRFHRKGSAGSRARREKP